MYNFLSTMTAAVVLFAFFITGCSARVYSKRQERSDQELPGYSGFAKGLRAPGESERKRTRKIYVLEVAKKSPAQEEKEKKQMLAETEEAIKKARSEIAAAQDSRGYAQPAKESPVKNQQALSDSDNLPYVEYEVLPDDTLQKIAKKFYDSYSKWSKIYEANKDLIPDPNRIRQGIILKIPKE